MRPVEDLERELARVTAERDALARHIEKLIAPASLHEAGRFDVDLLDAYQLGVSSRAAAVQDALFLFVARRQREGQFAAFNAPQLPLDP